MKTSKPRAGRSSKSTAPKTVDDYLAALPEPARGTLTKMRATIRSAVPKEVTEALSYGMPSFQYNKTLVWYAAFSKHCSLFPGSKAVIKMFESELKDLTTTKGTIHFPLDKPLPAALVKKIVKARLAEKQQKKSR